MNYELIRLLSSFFGKKRWLLKCFPSHFMVHSKIVVADVLKSLGNLLDISLSLLFNVTSDWSWMHLEKYFNGKMLSKCTTECGTL